MTRIWSPYDPRLGARLQRRRQSPPAGTTRHPLPAAQGAQRRERAAAVTPAWASDYFVAAPSTDTLSLQVHLLLRNAKAAEAELAAIGDPSGSSYGKFLSDAEYDAK